MSTDNNANSLNGSITEAPVAQDTNRSSVGRLGGCCWQGSRSLLHL